MDVLNHVHLDFSDTLSLVDADFPKISKLKQSTKFAALITLHWLRGWKMELELAIALVEEIFPQEEGSTKAEYEKLFLDVLLHVVFENTRSISYSPSSITNGFISFNISAPTPMVERYSDITPGTITGNTDYYKYDASQAFNISAYPVGGFATEFGFHSMPSAESWKQVLPPSDLTV